MPFTDEFGTWESLGTIPVPLDWTPFPALTTTPNSIFRIRYQGPIGTETRPPVFVRAVYEGDTQVIYDSNWVSVYPKAGLEVFEIPYLQDLQAAPLTPRRIELKTSSGYAYGPSLAAGDTFEIFEKIDSNVVYPSDPDYPLGDDPIFAVTTPIRTATFTLPSVSGGDEVFFDFNSSPFAEFTIRGFTTEEINGLSRIDIKLFRTSPMVELTQYRWRTTAPYVPQIPLNKDFYFSITPNADTGLIFMGLEEVDTVSSALLNPIAPPAP